MDFVSESYGAVSVKELQERQELIESDPPVVEDEDDDGPLTARHTFSYELEQNMDEEDLVPKP
jgi:hypothetical protein